MKRGRLNYLDFLRGFAAILVVLEHATQRLDLSSFDYFVSNWLSLGQLGVLIFFILSGYVIPYSYENVRGHIGLFWLSRVFRLYPLYILVIAATMIAELGFLGVHVHKLGLALLAHVIFIQEWVGLHDFGGPSWTLFLELIWYISFTMLCLLPIKRYFREFFTFIIATYAIVDLVSLFLNIHVPLGRVAYVYSFYIGYLCYLYRNQNFLSRQRFFRYLIPLLVVIFVSLVIGFGLHPKRYNTDLYFSVKDVLLNWTCGLGIFFLVFSFPSLSYPVILIYLGRISYSIYMVHPLVLEMFSHMSINHWIYLPLILGVTITISHFTYYYVERPFINFGHSISRRFIE